MSRETTRTLAATDQPSAAAPFGPTPARCHRGRSGRDLMAAADALFDRAVAFVALVLLAPVLAGMALAIRLDSRGAALSTPCAARDQRSTRAGRLLECTRLNELPRLFKVLAGEVPLLGPRPQRCPRDSQR